MRTAMKFRLFCFAFAVWGLTLCFCDAATLMAQVKEPTLPEKQQALSGKYDQLEAVLLRMAELNATSNPRRAALLKKVIGESKDKLITLRLEELVAILQRSRYTQAINAQSGIEKDLLELLKLLESENREKERSDEKEKIKEYIKAIDNLIHEQKSLKGRTHESDDAKPLSKEQKELENKAGEISQKMSELDSIGPASQDSKNDSSEKKEQGDKEQGDKKQGDKEKEGSENEKGEKGDKSESDSQEGKSDAEPKKGDSDADASSETPPQKSEQNSDDSPESSEDSSSKPSSSPSSPPQPSNQQGQPSPSDDDEKEEQKDPSQENLSPTQKAMQQAQRRMKRAKEQLEKAEKKGALEDQEEAIAELQRARAELERALRQLREEEMMQMLQQLDSRLRKMLQLEKSIRSQTERLQKQQADLLAGQESENITQRQIEILAGRIGLDQGKVLEEADSAIMLLREDGTAKALSESLEQTRFDMLEVAQRLNRTDLGANTIRIEDTIIESLQEMIDAVEQAKKDSQKRDEENKQGQNPPPGSPEEQRLIGILSELRMIRTMQRRINERTTRYEQQLTEENADLADLEKKVDELTRQQNRIQKILRDITLEKNQ